jgi:hypothetical protein
LIIRSEMNGQSAAYARWACIIRTHLLVSYTNGHTGSK